MDNTWLVIANSSKAYIYNLEHHSGELKDLPVQFREHHEAPLVHTLEDPKGRAKGIDLITDRPGGFRESSTNSHGEYSEHYTPHQLEEKSFAIHVAEFLEKELGHSQFKHLIICAEPHFCGYLKEHLHAKVTALVKHFILKDYVPLQAHGLRKVIEEIQKEK